MDPKYVFGLSLSALRLSFFLGEVRFWVTSGSRALFTGPINLFFSTKLSLKMGLTVIFTHLKIILL